MVGDGSYLMMNSEIATSVMLGAEADHRRARQPRLRLHQPPAAGDAAAQRSTTCCATPGTKRCRRSTSPPTPRSLGAEAVKVAGIAELEAALGKARAASDARRSIVIDTDPMAITDAGGAWWDVAVPEVSDARAEVAAARAQL